MWVNESGKAIYADADGNLVPEGPEAKVQVVAEGSVVLPKDAQRYGVTEEMLKAPTKAKKEDEAEADSGDEHKGAKSVDAPAGTKAEIKPFGVK